MEKRNILILFLLTTVISNSIMCGWSGVENLIRRCKSIVMATGYSNTYATNVCKNGYNSCIKPYINPKNGKVPYLISEQCIESVYSPYLLT